MILYLYILLVCYVPIINDYIPVLDLGSGIPNLDVSRLAFLLLFTVTALLVACKKIKLTVVHAWTLTLFCFASYALASLTWATRGYEMFNIQGIFDSFYTPIIIAVLGLSIFNDENKIKKFMHHMCIAVVCMMLISVYQYITSDKMIHSATMVNLRAAGTLGNANLLSIFYVVNIPAILYCHEKKIVNFKVLLIMFFSLSIGVFTTLSRKGFVMYFLSILLYYFFSKNYKKVVYAVIVGGVGVFLLMSYTLMSSRFAGKEMAHQFKGRSNMAMAGFSMLEKNPFLGLGFQGYYDNYGKYVPGASKSRKYSAHNIFITALVNYGIIGFPVFLLIFLLPAWRSFLSLRVKNKDGTMSDTGYRASMALSVIFPFMLGGFFAGGLFYQTSAIYLLYTYISMYFSVEKNKRVYRLEAS